jgi:nucleoside-diphosphate-sugar epimerase
MRLRWWHGRSRSNAGSSARQICAQHWSTVHVADVADFFRRVLEDDSAHGHYVVGNGVNSSVAELTEAAAVAAGAPGAVPVPMMRLGHAWATISPKSSCSIRAPTRPRPRAELGWRPSHPALVDEFRHGSYRKCGAWHLWRNPEDRDLVVRRSAAQ